ncbi:hypothetical protein [uncultured Aquabacterium sp.]|uniref:hypothetical protein n=1 Tax=uncultured Aquabacterium sp. TaxID=158753 RepID=UPI0025F2C1FB|nr:hypothetical protein [uncultured Aquabacterium sp.]
MSRTHQVQVIDYQTGEVVERIDAESARQAERIDAGLNINLNHECFYTRIVSLEKEPTNV